MKTITKIIICLTALIAIVGCSKKDDESNNLVGKWQRVITNIAPNISFDSFTFQDDHSGVYKYTYKTNTQSAPFTYVCNQNVINIVSSNPLLLKSGKDVYSVVGDQLTIGKAKFNKVK